LYAYSNPVNPAQNFAGAVFSQICRKWPDTGFVRARIQYIPRRNYTYGHDMGRPLSQGNGMKIIKEIY